MIRTRAMVLSLVLAGAGTVGCTFCDTCDDFPIPVTGGAGFAAAGPPPMMGPPAEGTFTAPVETVAPPADAASPFAAPAPDPEGAMPPPDTEGDTVKPQIPMPESNAEETSPTPPAPDAPAAPPESTVPLPGTAPESLPGTVPSPEPVIPPSALPTPGGAPAPPAPAPAAPAPPAAP